MKIMGVSQMMVIQSWCWVGWISVSQTRVKVVAIMEVKPGSQALVESLRFSHVLRKKTPIMVPGRNIPLIKL